MKFTISFYEKVTQEFGKKAAQLSRELAEQSKGKTIRNVEDALRTYEKYGQNINNKINAKDRAAIIKALEFIDAKQLASNLGKFSKGLGYTNHAINAVETLITYSLFHYVSNIMMSYLLVIPSSNDVFMALAENLFSLLSKAL